MLLFSGIAIVCVTFAEANWVTMKQFEVSSIPIVLLIIGFALIACSLIGYWIIKSRNKFFIFISIFVLFLFAFGSLFCGL